MQTTNSIREQNTDANMSTESNEVYPRANPVEHAEELLNSEKDKNQVAGNGKELTIAEFLENKLRSVQFTQESERKRKEAEIIEWCKGKFALNYFTTGSINKQDIQPCCPDFELTKEQIDEIYYVIDEIGEELVKGIGISVVLRLLRSNAWVEGDKDEIPEFETRDDRVKWFRQCFFDNPIMVVAVVHEINPALDLQWIMSHDLYAGEDAWYNALRVRLRYHLFTRVALVADVIFKGMLMKGDVSEVFNDTKGTKKMIHACFRRNPITDAAFGEVSMNDWPIKEPFFPEDQTKPWHTWARDWPGFEEAQGEDEEDSEVEEEGGSQKTEPGELKEEGNGNEAKDAKGKGKERTL
ncbi:hypothetical protein BJ875DRAFT_527118 [Amylocarpus encephaloides]|uniref:Uncharacterized protein n=1 Tax=Amylocarpus encephaloides TaxID=45428 RepID=A0A9P7YU07_9HELO|nr:hypothetical protein BJ875DRAFT_527118 [Amylocarpus encephaloides]